jgi:hypothetical protein
MVTQNPCKHLGEEIEKQQGCACNQSPKFKCAKYGECYKYTMRDAGVKVCAKCDDYEAN